MPVWVTEPRRDDSESLWGVGEGGDLESAKRSALKDVAAKLRVAISAQIESRIAVRNGSVDRYAQSRVSEDVQRTEFTKFTLEKSTPSAQGVYALVRVDRQAFVADTGQKLVAAEQEIDQLLSGIEATAPLERFISQQKALPWLEKAVSSSQVLSAVDPGFDGNRLRRHEAALAKARNAAGELTFDLQAPGDWQDVAQEVRGFLNATGIRVGKGGAPLVIESSFVQDVVFDSKSVKLRINMSVLDAQGRILTTREYMAYGSSVRDHRAARQAALKKLGEQLRTAGPVAALGFGSN